MANYYEKLRSYSFKRSIKGVVFNVRKLASLVIFSLLKRENTLATLGWAKFKVKNDWIGKNIYIGSFDYEILSYLRKIRIEGDIIDVGANVGYYTVFFSKTFKESTIYAFEPSPREYLILRENVRINRLSNVELFEIGLSDFNGESEFNISEEKNFGINSLKRLKENSKTITISLKKADDFIPKFQKIGFIKLDIEGSEYEFLIGAKTIIQKDRPDILFESWEFRNAPFSEWVKNYEVPRLLKSYGYEFFVINYLGQTEKIKKSLTYQQINILALHPEKEQKLSL